MCNPRFSRSVAPGYPFQIPLGALLPVRVDNLLPACKNLGTTRITSGAYRVHPVERSIGEAAGALAVATRNDERLDAQSSGFSDAH